MAMTYNSLVAPKGTTGSIMNWVGYSKLDIPTILDEAQSLLYSMLRVREMRSQWTFLIRANGSEIALPDGFLDPDGAIFSIGDGLQIDQRDKVDVQRRRAYDNSISGTLDSNPVTTQANSSIVAVEKEAHGLTQGSTVRLSGLSPVGGLAFPGSYPVTEIIDDDNFLIDTGVNASSAATGGGSGGSYTANMLILSTPAVWGIWDGKIKFDSALDIDRTMALAFYKSPALLSPSNQSNFLTNRYPRLLRTACQAMSADFMKDSDEYTKSLTALTALVQSTAAEDDLSYRGAIFGTGTP